MFTFAAQVASSGQVGSGSFTNTAVTLTRVTGTGPVNVSEEVTFTGLSDLSETASGITNGATATYQGSGSFGTKVGYVFTSASSLVIPGPILVLFDTSITNSESFDAIFYAIGSLSLVLGSAPACFAGGTMIATPSGEVAARRCASAIGS